MLLWPIVGGRTTPPIESYVPATVADCPIAFADVVPCSVTRTVVFVKLAAPSVICADQ